MNANSSLSSSFACSLADAAKWAFTTRRVDRAAVSGLSAAFETARAGDLVLGRVERIGSHKNIQLISGRPSALYPGDAVVLACGARYAADQFEGLAQIDPKGADMLAGGGALGRLREKNGRMAAPTVITPLGLLTGADAGMASTYREPLPRIIAALDTLLAEAAARDCDVAVVEIADGVLQRETAALLADPAARSAFDGFLYACRDALSAMGGVAALAPHAVRPLALTGLISRTPLARAEAEAATDLRVISREALRDPAEAMAALRAATAPLAAAA